jgi:hypothetical protein
LAAASKPTMPMARLSFMDKEEDNQTKNGLFSIDMFVKTR